ncbi:MAG: hypothetical protein QXP81_06265 [Nitrososphaerota archaeon]
MIKRVILWLTEHPELIFHCLFWPLLVIYLMLVAPLLMGLA